MPERTTAQIGVPLTILAARALFEHWQRDVHELKKLEWATIPDQLRDVFLRKAEVCWREFEPFMSMAYDQGFEQAEEELDGFNGVSGLTNRNPYRSAE